MTETITKAERDFDAALKAWDADVDPDTEACELQDAKRALFAAWWYVENCPTGAEGTTDVFFKVRGMVREVI